MNTKVTLKSVRDLYKHIQEQFYKDDNANLRMYDVGGDVCKIFELIIGILQKKDVILQLRIPRILHRMKEKKIRSALVGSLCCSLRDSKSPMLSNYTLNTRVL